MKIHPTALIHPDAKIDPSVEIGPYCTVGPRVSIGRGSQLVSHVVVDGWTEIGEENVIYPFSVIGAAPQDLKYRGENTRVVIGNHNKIRESVTINLGTEQGGGVTSVANHTLIMAYTHLGHDCIIGSHCIIANYGGFAGHVILEDYANIGGMVGISQFVRVGAYAYVAGQSGLEKDVPPFSVAIGSRPSAIKGTNIIGLKRRGFPAETILKINEAMKLWTRTDVQKEQCLKDIDAQYGSLPEIQTFIAFIRKTDTGVVR
jgi:UDP-N-acetylglucosamine acyltransferase